MFRFTFALVLLAGLFTGVASAQPLQRIAFGSCADQEKPQPIWEAVVATKPELFLFIGDNIYADTSDLDLMKAKYAKLAAIPGYQKLLKTCPLMAVWDDHDFGKNDAGTEFAIKKESQRVFLDFFKEPATSPRWKREGLYEAKVFGPPEQAVQVILLDTRYFRSGLRKKARQVKGVGPYEPTDDPAATVLGEAQWQWLAEQLKVPAKVRILASSIQIVAEDHGWEKWYNMPRERARLYKVIKDTGAGGIIALSGDRHLAELSMMDTGMGYPLYDLTSSGLNQGNKVWRPLEVNRHRVATMNQGNNFGLVTIDWSRPDPLVSLQIRDENGDVSIQHKVPLSVLQPGFLKDSKPPAKSVRLLDGTILTDAEINAELLPIATQAQTPPVWKAVTTDDGVWVQEGDAKVLFYQRRPTSKDGKFTRANYVHPLLGLDGEPLTEDFPADHLHHRGIFWAWHQVTIDGKSVGDPWALKECGWDIRDVKTEASDSGMSLRTSVHWLSPLWVDAKGIQKPFVREEAVIQVHRAEKDRRAVDFAISLTALEPALRIGGAAPTPGYGGFSPRLRLPKDVRFLGPKGEVQPLAGSVDPAPWIDIAGTFANERLSGVAMLTHPTTPGFPQPWILRRRGSMQNPVYPGATSVPLSTERPLVLRYRLVIHRGPARIEQMDGWQREYAEVKPRGTK